MIYQDLSETLPAHSTVAAESLQTGWSSPTILISTTHWSCMATCDQPYITLSPAQVSTAQSCHTRKPQQLVVEVVQHEKVLRTKRFVSPD